MMTIMKEMVIFFSFLFHRRSVGEVIGVIAV